MATLTEIEVTVTGMDPDTGQCLVLDALGVTFEVSTRTRRAGSGAPRVGERWRLERVAGAWVFDLQIGTRSIREIDGAAMGLHPVEKQLLAAMHQHGLLYDRTLDVGC